MAGKQLVHYGDYIVADELVDRTTIHESGTVDVVIDPKTGRVREVWFRCLSLPFSVSERPGPVEQPTGMVITAVEYLEDC